MGFCICLQTSKKKLEVEWDMFEVLQRNTGFAVQVIKRNTHVSVEAAPISIVHATSSW